MTKTVLITGASSGFGKETAKLFQNEGWNVIATMRSPENLSHFSYAFKKHLGYAPTELTGQQASH